MPTSFTAEAWARNNAVYQAILKMPFNRQLADGTLGRDRFQHYMLQDSHYLVFFAQALAVAAAKADTPDLVQQFSEAAATAIVVERDLHDRYFQQFGLTADQAAAVEVSPTCHHYGAFMIATAFREPLPVVVAALLPCFWIYREVGTHIHSQAEADNPYRAWIDTYAAPDFAAAVDQMIATTDRLAGPAASTTQEAMHRAFARAAQLEWMFWDSASQLEQWPIRDARS